MVVVDDGVDAILCCGETIEKFNASDYPPEIDERLESLNALMHPEEMRDPSLNLAGTSIAFISYLFEDYENEFTLIEFGRISKAISFSAECERRRLALAQDRYLYYYPEDGWEASCSKSDKTPSLHSLLQDSEDICLIDVAKRKVLEPDVLDE